MNVNSLKAQIKAHFPAITDSGLESLSHIMHNCCCPFDPCSVLKLQATSDYADDAAAAIGGISVGQLYHTAGAVKIRLV
jgi:hypothetical protein